MMTNQKRGFTNPIQPPANRQQLRSNVSHKFRIFMRLLCREEGVAVAELVEVTGWKAHSVRGFLDRLGKHPMQLELSIYRDRVNGNHRYQLRSYRVFSNLTPDKQSAINIKGER